ncbi:MAG: HAD-IB family hydrolase [Clostridiales bacterium]|nr:HAD-IB family hydrolase [Clostridiales bacterium]
MTKIAFFDFDGTCIGGDSIIHLVRYALKNGVSPLRLLPSLGWGILYKAGLADEGASKTHGLRFLQRMGPDERDAFCRDFARDDLAERVYSDAKKTIRGLKDEGYDIWLVSASTENYMRYVKDLLGADVLICTPIGGNGIVTGNCKGEEKVRRIKEEIAARGLSVDFSVCAAYGDSGSDLPVLNLAGRRYAVNAKKTLLKKAPGIERLAWS